MRYGIPLLGDRVAPRCTCADFMLVVSVARGRISAQERTPLDITMPLDLISDLRESRIDTLVCGGISSQTRETLSGEDITVIDNVACSANEVVAAIDAGRLHPGYGFGAETDRLPGQTASPADEGADPRQATGDPESQIDCLRCRDRICLRGENCAATVLGPPPRLSSEMSLMLEAAADISCEEERQLCRLAELVYFCLEMRFRRIGVAFCEDLREPAEILRGVLERFFETVSVCCRVGGASEGSGGPSAFPATTCHPVSQAAVLNRARTDLNVIVGLSMGADCVFTLESDAPVTTLFVKDRSLANNPIGAVYSERYLRESVTTVHPRSATDGVGREPGSPYRLTGPRSAREKPS
jgi:uncharacterized metal-binding protein